MVRRSHWLLALRWRHAAAPLGRLQLFPVLLGGDGLAVVGTVTLEMEWSRSSGGSGGEGESGNERRNRGAWHAGLGAEREEDAGTGAPGGRRHITPNVLVK